MVVGRDPRIRSRCWERAPALIENGGGLVDGDLEPPSTTILDGGRAAPIDYSSTVRSGSGIESTLAPVSKMTPFSASVVSKYQ